MAFDNASQLIYPIFLIFSGAALTSTLALFTRQSMLVAYMLIGIVLGPSCLNLVSDVSQIRHTGDIGIIFLLFLLGLHLPPQKLLKMMSKISIVGVASSMAFLVFGSLVTYSFGFSLTDSLIVGAAMMFSSTIIGIKLLPTTILHHQHTGEVMISVLLFQDLVAILVLLAIKLADGGGHLSYIVKVALGFPCLLVFAFVVERYFLMWLFRKFSRIKEYLFLLSIAWCLGMSFFAVVVKLPFEIGAFIAGVSLATSPISVYIAESLKPVRDFFLVLYFFYVGASFYLSYFLEVYIPAVVLAFGLFALKPFVYRFLLKRVGEEDKVAWEVGSRLGQISEFSLIIGTLAVSSTFGFNDKANCLIQATAMISFALSSYWVVLRYPTPVSLSNKMRRD